MDKELREKLEALVRMEDLEQRLTTRLNIAANELVHNDIGYTPHIVSYGTTVLKVWKEDGFGTYEEIGPVVGEVPQHTFALAYALREAVYELRRELLTTLPTGKFLVGNKLIEVGKMVFEGEPFETKAYNISEVELG